MTSLPHYIAILLGCRNGAIRLVGRKNLLAGRVEVCYEGVWGTVCASPWNNVDAKVVCRQLGYATSGISFQRLKKVITSARE